MKAGAWEGWYLDEQGGGESELIFHLVNGKKKNFHSDTRWSWHVIKRKTHLGAEKSVQWVKYFLYKPEEPDSFTRTHMKKPGMVRCASNPSAGVCGSRGRQTHSQSLQIGGLVKHSVSKNRLDKTWGPTSDIHQAPHSPEHTHTYTPISTHLCTHVYTYIHTWTYLYTSVYTRAHTATYFLYLSVYCKRYKSGSIYFLNLT